MERLDLPKKALAMAGDFVYFNNHWDGTPWKSNLQDDFDKKMEGLLPILKPVRFENNAKQVLYENEYINKLMSILLDSYDELPYHPDNAFDSCWRAFEILMSMYDKDVFNMRDNVPMQDLVARTCQEIKSVICTDKDLEDAVENLIAKHSLSGFSFLLNRMVDTDNLPIEDTNDITALNYLSSLMIDDQSSQVNKRVKHALGDKLYEAFCNCYFNRKEIAAPTKKEPNKTETHNVEITGRNRNFGVQCLPYIMSGRPFTIYKTQFTPEMEKQKAEFQRKNDKLPQDQRKKFVDPREKEGFDGLPLENRLELTISGILYTSRCNRFHGDFYSPFKSSESGLQHYYEYYYFFIYTYEMFWILLKKYLKDNDIDCFFETKSIVSSLNESLKRLERLPNNIGRNS